MFLKIATSIALACCLAWLYLDRSVQPVVAVCISSLALCYAMFKPGDSKAEQQKTINKFNVNTGKDSNVNQSAGDITINHGKDVRNR